MKKCLPLVFLFAFITGFSQGKLEDIIEEKNDSIQQFEKLLDTIVYEKDINFSEKRTIKSNLKEKYNDKDFIYIDDIKEPEKDSSPINYAFLEGFIYFMRYIFPFILGIGIVIIILKTFLGTEIGFWNFKKSNKKNAEKLVYEDEDIHETDFNQLLQKSISDKNYRLATRYYYLLLLKKLTDTKKIEYHKDKTNTEYVFEIENKEIRNQFSEVSYIYSYVWYGEFPVDSSKFKTVEKKYKSIFKSIN